MYFMTVLNNHRLGEENTMTLLYTGSINRAVRIWKCTSDGCSSVYTSSGIFYSVPNDYS